MVFKPKILTIILVLVTAYLFFSTWDYNTLKNKQLLECDDLKTKILPYDLSSNLAFMEAQNSWERWNTCIDSYTSLFMMYNVYSWFSLVFIFLLLISSKIDYLKRS